MESEQLQLETVKEGDWDIVLRPQSKWYNLDLKGLWHYRDLVWLMVRRDFFVTYKQTILGPLWMLLQPLLMSLMFSVIFGRVAGIPTGGAPRILFYTSAFFAWTYFAESFNKISATFTTNSAIFGKVYFPRLVMPIATIVSGLFRFAAQLLLFVILYFFYVTWHAAQVHANLHVFFIPVLLLILAGYAMAGGLLVSSVTVKYRDLNFVIVVAIQLLMYGSSIVFSISDPKFPAQYREMLKWNPMVWLMEGFRNALIGVGQWSWHGLAYSALVMFVLLFLAIVNFNRVEKNFMDTV